VHSNGLNIPEITALTDFFLISIRVDQKLGSHFVYFGQSVGGSLEALKASSEGGLTISSAFYPLSSS